jgi:hypothetical protein
MKARCGTGCHGCSCRRFDLWRAAAQSTRTPSSARAGVRAMLSSSPPLHLDSTSVAVLQLARQPFRSHIQSYSLAAYIASLFGSIAGKTSINRRPAPACQQLNSKRITSYSTSTLRPQPKGLLTAVISPVRGGASKRRCGCCMRACHPIHQHDRHATACCASYLYRRSSLIIAAASKPNPQRWIHGHTAGNKGTKAAGHPQARPDLALVRALAQAPRPISEPRGRPRTLRPGLGLPAAAAAGPRRCRAATSAAAAEGARAAEGGGAAAGAAASGRRRGARRPSSSSRTGWGRRA